jgi:hypothetical protein
MCLDLRGDLSGRMRWGYDLLHFCRIGTEFRNADHHAKDIPFDQLRV